VSWGLFALTCAAIRREFLGWDRPALPEAARRLGEHYRRDQTLDLGKVIIVLPGQRAGRRLQELLAYFAEDESLRFTPAQMLTEGTVPEQLYTPKFPFASDLVQDLAWARALRDLPAEKRKQIIPHAPGVADTLRWLELGKHLRQVHVELAADGLDFTAVQRKGPQIPGFTETQRWEALVAVQKRYLELLDGQELWDIQTARLKAIEFREIQTHCDIVLLGTVDVTNTLRQMLDQVAAQVTAYIAAPEDLASHFDAHGCLVPGAWRDAMVPLSDRQLFQVDGPVEQAEAVSAWLGDLGGRYRNDEVVIGVPDESLVPQLQRQLAQCGVRARWVEGVLLSDTAPFRLLGVALQYAGTRRYEDLAALLRHPDLEDWLTVQPAPPGLSNVIASRSLPGQLDQFYNRHLPNRLEAKDVAIHNSRDWPDLRTALERIEEWLAEASAKHPLRAWGDIFRNLLGAVYGGLKLRLEEEADEVLHKTILRILKACEQLGSIPPDLDEGSVSAPEAFRFALGRRAGEPLPPPADPEAVELLGWLELPLDDAPALVVTSFNDGFVPKSTGADAFLPDRLRRELGLLHNERRYARDAYATTVLCRSRPELRVLFARRDANQDPLQPSRLLFACHDNELIGRARLFFGKGEATDAPPRTLHGLPGPFPTESRFSVPLPLAPERRLVELSVTRFKSYLACPYRYYLQFVQELEPIDDGARELDGRAFGVLIHAALSDLGRTPGAPRESTREKEVFEFLVEQLQERGHNHYGSRGHRAALRLQLEQARERLRAFAAVHAKMVKEGWRIVHAESTDDKGDQLRVPFVVDGEPVRLVGRIDRIDLHAAERKLRILDYKTADTAQKPEKTHRNKERWIDLQLPLYRHLWRAAHLDVPDGCVVELGYLNLPKQADEAKFEQANWDDADLRSADETAQDVIRKLRCGVFWEPAKEPPEYSEAYAAICLDNVRSPPGLPDELQEGIP
jgi:hypothetical protein